jgi:WhiB family redox-sensing transcriptional regulator
MIRLPPPLVYGPITDQPAEFNPQVAREAAARVAYPTEGQQAGTKDGYGFGRGGMIRTLPPRPPRVDDTWREQAACRGMDTALWFPERGETGEEARQVCDDCPVRSECLDSGISEPYGIWGGKGDRARQQERKHRGVGYYHTHPEARRPRRATVLKLPADHVFVRDGEPLSATERDLSRVIRRAHINLDTIERIRPVARLLAS